MWHYFPGHYMPSYQVNRALTQAHYGGGEFAEILEVASEIDPANRETFNLAWLKKGNEVFEWAEAYEKKSAFVSARRTYLRAFNYLRSAEFFMNLHDDRKNETYIKAREAFLRAIKYFDEKPLTIEVPFEGSFLPGYLFKPAGVKNPPVMVMFGGLDSLAEELYFGIGNHLNERGIALLAIDGPGQGAALRLNHIHSRYDFNVAGTAVLDWVLENLQAEVDTTSVGIAGVSMGGYMAARCAAFEPRFKVCMIFGAVWSYYSVWAGRNGKHPLAEIVMHIMDAESYEEVLEKLKGYTLENGVAEKISMPTFIMHGGGDKQNFVEHAIELEKHLTCEHQMKIVPEGESGAQHCQVDDFMPTLDMYDWIAEKIKA
ncbi:alpha/beta hydrolase family protein [Jiulongibacter sp. NS-SX5]|uniref:alpha/beta hydrolase family protein n=1 Tax=Jiulongibacter sp. NS-SX5 TaxID=3463854 RepID=UPI0040594EE4